MLLRRTTAVVCALAAAIAVAGCGGGGSSGVTPTAYVTKICQAVGPFEKDVASRESALNPTNIKNAAQGKTALVGFLQAVSADTGKALAQVKSAGVPNVTNGKKIQGAIVSAFTRLDQTMKSGAQSAKSLPTGSPSAFQKAVSSLDSTVRNSLSGVGSSLSNLRSAKLEKAAAKAPACKSLSS